MEATAQKYYRSRPAQSGCVDQQADATGISHRTGSSFNSRRALSCRPHRGTVGSPHYDGKQLEDAFWKGKKLQGRNITSIDVLKVYGNDRTSLRSGFFLEKLCLNKTLHNNREITPDEVIEEFNRAPSHNTKCQLAIARFKAECCLRGLPLNGQQVTPDAVVKDFPESPEGKLGIARYKAECCLRGLPLNGQQVTPDAVVKDFPESTKGKLGIARFKAECCLRGLPLNGEEVTPDAVIKDFPESLEGKLGIARFKAECCLRGLPLKGREVTPDAVVKDYQAVNATLELARFKAECCLRGLSLNGQRVSPDAVVKDFPESPEGKLGIVRFIAECCLRGLPLNGQRVTPDAVVKDYQAVNATLELARFKEQCCLRGLPLKDREVTPDAVVKDYQAVNATLELARFKQQCCLRGLPLNGQQITPDAVVKDFPESPEGKLGIARFKAECCLRGLPLNGQQVTPDAVVKDFPESPEGKLGIARFKEQYCLRGLPLNGQQVTPDAVVKDFPESPEGKLGIARFKAECCLRGLPLKGREVTPDAVVKDYQAVNATLELARFKAECCLRGLPLNGQEVTPDAMVKDYKAANATLELTRFKAECCLRGLPLNGQRVSPDAVVKDFPESPEGKLGIVRFIAECCLRGLPLNGREVTPDAVVKDYQAANATLELARFKEQCCLRGLPLNGLEVIPDAVVKDFPESPEGKLGIARFKAECCLRGLPLDGRKVTPDAVVKDYKKGGWLLERAIFYSQLALNAKDLNGNYLNNREVLDAFNNVPGDHSSRQTEFLIQRLKTVQLYDDANENQDVFQQARQILKNALVKDDQHHRLQCILYFMAMQHELTVNHQKVSAEQVWQSIKALRRSFKNTRLLFFFLAHCYITKQPLDGQEIHKDQVLDCLHKFPEGSKLRHALGCWFEECNTEANISEELLFRPVNPVVTPGDSNRQQVREASAGGADFTDVNSFGGNSGQRAEKVEVYIPNFDERGGLSWRFAGYYHESLKPETASGDAPLAVTANATQTLKHLLKIDESASPDKPVPKLSPLTNKTLETIQEINGHYTAPTILITGSFSRYLQNLCSSFNDIDIICTTEEAARILIERLSAENTDMDSEIPQKIIIWPIPGCAKIRVPKAYNIILKEGDLGTKTMGFQVSIDSRLAPGDINIAPVHLPGVERPVRCLSFAAETGLLNDTLKYLADYLDPLTEQLQQGTVFDIPRTILFNYPKSREERICGLFMRCLLTLNKAGQFHSLLSERKSGYQPEQFPREQQFSRAQRRLQELTDNLQTKLNSHAYRDDFMHRVKDWLSTTQHVNDYEIKRREFIKGLLKMVRSE